VKTLGEVVRLLVLERQHQLASTVRLLVAQVLNVYLPAPTINHSVKHYQPDTAAVWCTGIMLVSINEVNVHQARLVLGWVTVSGFNFNSQGRHFISVCNQPPVNSAFYPPWDGKISTSQMAVMLCGWGVKAGMARVLPYLSALENAI